jgi:hypothetical protein
VFSKKQAETFFSSLEQGRINIEKPFAHKQKELISFSRPSKKIFLPGLFKTKGLFGKNNNRMANPSEWVYFFSS